MKPTTKNVNPTSALHSNNKNVVFDNIYITVPIIKSQIKREKIRKRNISCMFYFGKLAKRCYKN